MVGSVKERWAGLSSAHKQYVVWGAGILVLMALGTFIFGSPAKKVSAPGVVKARVANDLMPAGAARDLGVSSLATGLQEQARDQKQLSQSVDRLRQQQEAAKNQRETNADRETARRTQEELEVLRRQIEALQQGGVSGGAPAQVAAPTPAQGGLAPMAGGSPVLSQGPSGVSSGAIREIGAEPAAVDRVPATSNDAPAKPGVPSVPGTATTKRDRVGDDKVPTQYLPSGSMMQVVSITGMDAPTGRQAMKDPLPMLFRVKASAVLPNRYRADVRECFVVASGHGDLASERAYLRSTSISCIRTDKRVIDVQVEMVAIGPDGKAGIRGRLVSKQGQVIAKAAAAGLMQSIGQAFSGGSYRMNFGADNVDYGTALQQGAGGGLGSAFDRIAKYYLDMADQMFPVVEIDAGQKVTFMLVKGAQMGFVK